MDNIGFKINLKVLDEWVSQIDRFRLVDLGAGPVELQVQQDGEWVPEQSYFKWGIVTHRLLELKGADDA